MTDLLAEQIDLMVSQAAVALPNLQAGTIKPIANLSPRRSLAVPEIPSSDESGVPAGCGRAVAVRDAACTGRSRIFAIRGCRYDVAVALVPLATLPWPVAVAKLPFAKLLTPSPLRGRSLAERAGRGREGAVASLRAPIAV
jgi:hypothetical protein